MTNEPLGYVKLSNYHADMALNLICALFGNIVSETDTEWNRELVELINVLSEGVTGGPLFEIDDNDQINLVTP